MTTEDRLRESLHRRAEAVRVAPGAWTQIAAGTENRRRRRFALAAAVGAPVVIALVVAVLATSGGDNSRVRVVDSGPVPRADLWLLRSTPAPNADVIDGGTRAKRSVTVTGLAPHLRLQHGVRRGEALVVDQAFGNTDAPNVFVVEPDGSSRPLGAGSGAVPSTVDDRVWIVSRDATTVREVDLAGRETTPTRPLPPGFLVGAAVEDGLVGNERSSTDSNGPITNLSVWNPLADKIVRRWPGSLLEAAGTTVVWKDRGGRVHLADERTGTDRLVAVPAGISTVSGVGLSPDGRTVALLGGAANDFTLSLVDAPTGRVTHLAGWEGRVFSSIGWSADSSWFYFAGARRDGGPFQLYAVRRGAGKVTPLRVTVANFETASVGPGF